MQVIAAELDQSKIATLKIEQSHLISSLKNKHESLEKKILRLGEIIEERFIRNDPSLAKEGIIISNINQISRIIKDIFFKAKIKIYPWVHDYCKPQWKNGYNKQDNFNDEIAATPRKIEQLLELCNSERELSDEIPKLSASQMDSLYTLLMKLKPTTEAAARDIKHLLPGHEEKEPKETPKTDPEFTEEHDAIQWVRDVALKKYQDYVYRFPGPPEKREYWASGWKELGLVCIDAMNLKSSLIKVEWEGRIQYMYHQSKHGAAVYEEIETMICDECFDDETGKEKPDCNAEMEWDHNSITKYRCPTCGGTKGKLRGLTREQCGDNKEPVCAEAQRLQYALPGFFESILDRRVTEVDKRIYGRKVLLSEDLRKEA